MIVCSATQANRMNLSPRNLQESGRRSWGLASQAMCLAALLLGGCQVGNDSTGAAVVPASTDRPVEERQRVYSGSPPRVLATRDGDYKISASGYADYVRDGFKPRVDLAPYRLDFPLDWRVNPYRDNNWRFQLQAWRMLNPMWGEYRRSGASQVLERILEVVRDWDRFHIRDGRYSSYQWQDMATGLRAQHLAYLNHLASSGKWVPSSTDREMLDRLTDIHVRTLHDDTFISVNNHGIFQVHGLRLLCNSAPALEACLGEPVFSADHLRTLIESQFDERGVHREDSSFYHLFAYKTFRGIRMSLYPGLPRETLRRIRLAETISPWFTALDGDLLQFGDSEGRGVPFKKPADAGPCVSNSSRGHCIVARNMTRSGYVAIRTRPGVPADEASLFFVVGSSHDAGHDHVDELSFFLTSRGVPLFVDGGKYGYQDDAYRRFFVSDHAHSVVGLEGETFAPAQTRGEGSYLDHYAEHAGRYEVSGHVKRGDAFAHDRTFSYQPERSLEILDTVEKPAAAAIELRYVLAPGLVVSEQRPGHYALEAAEGGLLATVTIGAEASCKSRIAHGSKAPQYAGWISRSYLEVEATTTILTRCPPTTNTVKTLISLE